ncbi:MAG: His/Gly/Thr/Pro-type tRNA ligase C-terminal domain-containing protein, partial [bacterium]|nr:His/Gly/Thr/Pro-type tRNA ligase C-terminal domain-containing protein [bacterium]
LDMNLPGRFKLEYTDETGKKKEPVVLHRAILGSTERFLGILIEHFAGAFPLWLSPEQVRILPVSDKFVPYANDVKSRLQASIPSLRVSVSGETETLGRKIRDGETMKVPYLLIIGEKEQGAGTVSPRKRGSGDLGAMSQEHFLSLLEKELQEGK